MINEIDKQINKQDFISVRDFINLSNKNYYEKEQVFGALGDFITAPEISQIFGELIAMFAISIWHQHGKPKSFRLVELGAGRATLLKDFLLLSKQVGDFFDCLDIHIIEQSQSLKKIQVKNIFDILTSDEKNKVSWHDEIKDIPKGYCFFLGNEFLDALGTIQLVKGLANNWHERIIVKKNEKLCFDINKELAQKELIEKIPENVKQKAKRGNIFEINFDALNYIDEICNHISKNSGTALFIDYGHKKSNIGETLQAIKKHQFVDVLENYNQADITTHIDFENLEKQVSKNGLVAQKTMSQGDFLLKLGAEYRIKKLLAKANLEEAKMLLSGANRLIDKKQMGELFKAFYFSDKQIDVFL